MKKWYLGIDPGQKGAIALVNDNGEAVEYCRMPDTVKGIIETIDEYLHIAWAHPASVAMIAEKAQPMPKQGSVSGFTYGRHFGAFEVVAMVRQVPYHEVRPTAWKKAMKVVADKASSIMECERIFPAVNLILPRCRTKHDGIAEALLIAEWGHRSGL